jgi:predicted acyltransferase
LSFKEKLQKFAGVSVRFEWLDQFRGLAILLFIIQTTAAYLLIETGFPIFAPHLNHGINYAQVVDWPPLITLIDTGRYIFIFLVGFMAAFTVSKYKQKGKSLDTILFRIIRRLASILAINYLIFAAGGTQPIKVILLDSTLGYIAWVGFIVSVITFFIKKPDQRFLLGLLPFIVQFILDFFLDLDSMWMNLMGLVGVGLVASAFATWMLKVDGTVDESNFKKRILPVVIGSFVVMFIVEFFQWADYENSTVALCALGIGISGLALFIFYHLEKYDFKIPLLSPLGKNLLIVGILEMVLIELLYMNLFLFDFIQLHLAYPLYHLLFAGIVPIVILWGIAKVLADLKLYLRV